MGKISKFANIYDKNGNLIRKVNEDGVLENYTIEELEMLIDQLSEDYKRDGGQVTKFALDYANGLLMQLYMKHGNPHQDEILAKLKEQYGDNKSTGELVQSALNDLAKATENVESDGKRETVMDEYVEPIEETNGTEKAD